MPKHFYCDLLHPEMGIYLTSGSGYKRYQEDKIAQNDATQEPPLTNFLRIVITEKQEHFLARTRLNNHQPQEHFFAVYNFEKIEKIKDHAQVELNESLPEQTDQ